MTDPTSTLTSIARGLVAGFGQLSDTPARGDWIAGLWADEPQRANWCAAFASTALRLSGVPVPRRGRPIRGALALARWLEREAGWTRTIPECVGPGDVVLWQRGGPWQRHVAIVVDCSSALVRVAEGNVGNTARVSAMSPAAVRHRLRGLDRILTAP